MPRQGWRAIALSCVIAALTLRALTAQEASGPADPGTSTASESVARPQASLASARLSDQRTLPDGDAAGSADPNSMSAVMARLQRAQEEMAEIRQQMEAPAAKQSPTTFAALLTALQDAAPQMNTEDRIATLEAALLRGKPFPLVRLSGFFQYDTGWYNQDAASKAVLGNAQNGSGFRRTRLQALGKLSEFTNFSIEMDFASAGRPSFLDVWGEQTNLPFGAVRIGQFRQPISMDGWTSVRHLQMMERSAAQLAFDPFRRVGIMNWWNSENGRTLIAGSIYGAGVTYWNSPQNGGANQTQYAILGTDDRDGSMLGNGVAAAVRGVHLLYYDEPSEGRYLMAVGGSYNFSQIGGSGGQLGANMYRSTTFPEFFVGDSVASNSVQGSTPNVLDTGRFLAHNYSLYNLEWAANYGSWNFQSEWFGTAVAQYGGPLVFYDGAYAQVGYFLTGESAGYAKNMGAMDYNCKPFSEFFGLGTHKGICGWGAWEVAARWTYVDLQSNRIKASNYAAGTNLTTPGTSNGLLTGPSAGNPNPGVLNESTVGLNWYWNQFAKVQLNWIHCMLSSQFHGQSAMDIYAIRYQAEF
jgi:phosphate-selective porin OprO and OprP